MENLEKESTAPLDDTPLQRRHVDPVQDPVARFWADEWDARSRELLRYVSALLGGDGHAAEDVVQETAIRLWQHPELLLGDRGLGVGWLRTVARNIVVDNSRRRRARPAEVPFAPDAEPADGDVAVERDTGDAVATILSVLPPRQRATVFEVYVRDRPMADVAADLDVATGTVKSRCHYALLRLRESAGLPG